MCGFGNKICATCFYSGGCIASMNEDFYLPASMQTVISRLDKNKYPRDRKAMKEFLVRNYLYDYEHHSFITVE